MSHEASGHLGEPDEAAVMGSQRRPVQWASLLHVTWRAFATWDGVDHAMGRQREQRGTKPSLRVEKEAGETRTSVALVAGSSCITTVP